MSVIQVDNTAGFGKLAPYWNGILQQSYSPDIFRTWEWLFTWWETFGHERGLRIFAIQEGSKLVAIAPLYVKKARVLGLQPVSVVRLIGDDVIGSDFLDWIVPYEREAELVPILAEAVLAEFGPHAVFDCWDIAADSVVARRVFPRLVEHGVLIRQRVRYRCPYLELPGSYSEFEARLSRSTRDSLRRKVRKLQREHEVELWRGGDEVASEEALRIFWQLHAKRWREKGTDSCSHPAFRTFHDRLLSRLRQNIDLHLLRIDGRIVAAQYNFRFQDKAYQYQSGFDPEFSRVSPGTVLMMRVLQSCIERGLLVFEMLRGEEGYKRHLTRAERFTYRVYGSQNKVALNWIGVPQRLRLAKRSLQRAVLNLLGSA